MDQNGKQNCLLHGENPILQDDLKKVIKELFSSNPKLTSSQISQILQQKQVDGLELNINRMVSNDGIVNFEYDFPELVFIDKNVIDNNKTQNQINKKVLKPYYKYLRKNQKKINESSEGLQVPKELREKLEKIISHGLPNGMNSKVVSDYYLNNILKLDDKELQKTLIQSKALQVYSKYNIFKNSKAEIENALNMINTSSRNNFYKCNGDLTKLATILSGVSAELYMNSVNLKDKNPTQVEEILQKGYRTVNVGFGKKDVLLHKKGDNIKKAMEHLSESIVNLIKEEPNMSEEEYIKKVGMLHFRYISIHPFRDSNGRTSRNLINMLLAPKEKILIIDRKDKKEYLSKMNEMRNKLPLQTYLESLSTNPNLCENYEKEASRRISRVFRSTYT